MPFPGKFIAIHLAVLSTVMTVHIIHVGNQAGQLSLMHIIFQITAILCSQCQLPIRKRTGTTPAAHNIHALFTAIPMRILVQFQSMMNIMSFFKNQNGSPGIGKLQRSKDSGRAGADNYYIIIFHAKTTLHTKKRLPYAGGAAVPCSGIPSNNIRKQQAASMKI